MATKINLPRRVIQPGSYAQEILAPNRANAAQLTMTPTNPRLEVLP